MKRLNKQLLGDLVAVQPDISRQEGQIILPDWQQSLVGSVLACGPEALDVKRGNRVYFGAATGMEAAYDGINVRIMREEDILLVVEYDH